MKQGREMIRAFRDHVENDVWNLIAVTDSLLRPTATLTGGMGPSIPLRAGDAIHLVTALEAGETEIWTNDRHLLAAAPHFGIVGRSV
jgi:predicted nucleic acid-binding protein